MGLVLSTARMTRRMRRGVVATFVMLSGACATGEESPPTNGAATDDGDVLDATFDVGPYELYMRYSGTGSPTVVYLHG